MSPSGKAAEGPQRRPAPRDCLSSLGVHNNSLLYRATQAHLPPQAFRP
uniref:Uncharacterized protein n=1 Tax=Anguilla anguilla TaxID=7936 RepID=A0A0E9TAS7_ANGAN